MTDEELVFKVTQERSNEALIELAERHTGIYLETVKKYLPFTESKSDLEDFIDDKYYVLYKAAESFNPEKGTQFITWFANMARYNCLNERTKLSKTPVFLEFEEKMGGETEMSPEKYLDLKSFSEYTLKRVEEKFDKRASNIIKDIFFGGPKKTGQTLAEVAKKYNVSTQAIHVTKNKVLDFLRDENSIQRPY